MHGPDYFCIVFKNNSDGVPYFGTDERPQNPEVFPFGGARLAPAKGFVRIFSVNGFSQRYRPGAIFQFRSWCAGQILSARRVVP
jgi:hypothetical protein